MLTLPIKKKWFDMILSGEKHEEYRRCGMSKSILVIDTPENCDYCPVGRIFGMEGQVECMAGKDIVVNNNGMVIPDWCPLRDLPERANHPYYFDNGRYDKGWNDCIDEILKEEGKNEEN